MPSVRHHISGLGTDGETGRADAVTLVERAACPACGGTDHQRVWGDRFDADALRGWWDETGYETDVASVLAGERFELIQCSHCSLRYQRRVLADNDLRALYSTWISPAQAERCQRLFAAEDPSRFACEASRHAVGRLLTLRRAIPAQTAAPPRLLDFGCGDGGFVALAAAFGFDAQASTSARRAGHRPNAEASPW